MSIVDGDGNASATETLFRTAQRIRMQLLAAKMDEQRALLLDLDVSVIVHSDRIEVNLDTESLANRLGVAAPDAGERYPLQIPTVLLRWGTGLRLTIAPEPTVPSQRDPKLIALIVKAHVARRQLLADASALDDQRRNDLARLARLSFLAPDIIGAILEGRQPVDLNANRLVRASAIPIDWREQRQMLRFA